MVKSAQDVASDDAAAALNGSAMWGVFLQAEMGPCRVVIRNIFHQDTPKMGLAPHDHVVKTLTSDRDCALDISVLPWRSRRCDDSALYANLRRMEFSGKDRWNRVATYSRSIKGERAKQPFAVAMKERSPFAIAGLWENWHDPQSGEWIRTFVLLTVPANELVAQIHDRMPLILPTTAYERWLGTDADPHDLLVPFPADLMVM
jgi:putative SOS response-associated peptidase YedK